MLADYKIKESEFSEEELKALGEKVAVLQQKVKEQQLPVMILFDGWGASGKGVAISDLINNLDPRGFKVFTNRKPTAEEMRYPVMRKFWLQAPPKGKMAIFDRSWYREVSNAIFEREDAKKHIEERFEEILDFENQMIADGYLIIKIFLDISAKKQKDRFKKLEAEESTAWRITEEDWKQNNHYETYSKIFSQMIEKTDMPRAEWYVIEAGKRKQVRYEVLKLVAGKLEAALAEKEKGIDIAAITPPLLKPTRPAPIQKLKDIDPNKKLDKDYKKELNELSQQLFLLHNELYQKKIPMVIGFEGWDAAGKGGAIRRLTHALDPRGYEVIPIASPTPTEKSHQHLWRFYEHLPKNGHITVFDRTWYGRVLVERIEGFCSQAEWERAYEEINRFEKLLTDSDTIVVKFWLQIDKDEQLRRFNVRQNTPEKQYKITDEDWRNRKKWDIYEKCVNQMLQKTNTKQAPWVIVEANNKQYARIKVLKTVISHIKQRLKEKD
ncbi:MAG: polyphosphate:AMP phosphotransferase [Spirochaetia bacterium]|nr:polyphosphate:AMP phosphotransferase [Spirochaetia bacterium]